MATSASEILGRIENDAVFAGFLEAGFDPAQFASKIVRADVGKANAAVGGSGGAHGAAPVLQLQEGGDGIGSGSGGGGVGVVTSAESVSSQAEITLDVRFHVSQTEPKGGEMMVSCPLLCSLPTSSVEQICSAVWHERIVCVCPKMGGGNGRERRDPWACASAKHKAGLPRLTQRPSKPSSVLVAPHVRDYLRNITALWCCARWRLRKCSGRACRRHAEEAMRETARSCPAFTCPAHLCAGKRQRQQQ